MDIVIQRLGLKIKVVHHLGEIKSKNPVCERINIIAVSQLHFFLS